MKIVGADALGGPIEMHCSNGGGSRRRPLQDITIGRIIMKHIELDTGVEEFSFAGGGVLRFNPCDPNLYARFLEMEDKMQEIEDELNRADRDGSTPEVVIRLSREADRKAKELLNRVFGGENDFDKILGGVSLLAVTGNGQRVVSNLMAVLETILTEGAARFATTKADAIRAVR